MLAALKKFAHPVMVRLFPSFMGYHIQPKGQGYFNAKTIVNEAGKQGLSVTEYLETSNYGGVGKRRDEIISSLQNLNFLPVCKRIVEIGAGTGMYLEKFIDICHPEIL